MNGLLDFVFAPFVLFMERPFLAFLPALAFLAYFFGRRPAALALKAPGPVRWSLVASLLWFGYAFWELSMRQWSKTVAGAPIRIDIFLIAPALYVITAAAIWRCLAFEKTLRGGPEPVPVKPIQPGPYTLQRNFRFVIGFAVALARHSFLSSLAWNGVQGLRSGRGVLGILVVSVLAVFLVRGRGWARWCLVLWFLYGALHHLVGWSSLRDTGRQDMEVFRDSHLVSLVTHVAIGAFLLTSKRLREYLGVRSSPESTSLKR